MKLETEMYKLNILIFAVVLCVACGFSIQSSRVSLKSTKLQMANNDEEKKGGLFGAFGKMFEELDSFVDDATNRRLGNGSAFYGKRKSEFYGENDKGKKKNKKMADNTEDYNAPSAGGYFQWMQDEEGNMRPVTRMKKKIVENKRMKR